MSRVATQVVPDTFVPIDCTLRFRFLPVSSVVFERLISFQTQFASDEPKVDLQVAFCAVP